MKFEKYGDCYNNSCMLHPHNGNQSENGSGNPLICDHFGLVHGHENPPDKPCYNGLDHNWQSAMGSSIRT